MIAPIKNKSYKFHLFCFTLFLLLVEVSCQKVITLNLNSTSRKLVIEGSVNNLPGPYTLKISRTTNYFDNASSVPESGAIVIISDNIGLADSLKEGTTPGTYMTSHLIGSSGKDYMLHVLAGGQKYTATQNMMDSVAIDSVSSSIRVNQQTQLPQYMIRFSFTDPVVLGNYYGFSVYLNNILHSNVINNRLIDDQLSNGKPFHITFRNEDFAQYDTLKLELITFNKNTYDFYNTIKQTMESGSPFSAPPANPVTDLSNGALGFFGAFAISSRTIVLR